MMERRIDIATSSGAMETFVVHPSEGWPFPAVILYMDVWGIREELLDIARRIATVGYYCVVPDFYYRQGRVRTEFRNEKNQMISMDRLDERQRQLALAPLAKLTDAMVVEDTDCVLGCIDRGEPVRPGPIGVVGYCMGGRHVFRVMGQFPQRIRASACLHGSLIVTADDVSPHLSAKKGAGELYCGLAEKDRHAQMPTIKALNETSWNLQYRYELHKGAHHGYALPDRDVFDKHAANRDWELIFAMFRRQIPLSPAR
jgi:carboxymethylenebutenolidase